MEFVVEKVLGHAGDTKKPTTMSFHVKGSTTRTLIIHGSRGNYYGSVKHSMIIYGIMK